MRKQVRIVIALFLSTQILMHTQSALGETVSAEDDVCVAHYQYDSLIRLFAASYVVADEKQRVEMLNSEEAFSNGIVNVFNKGLIKDIDENEDDVFQSYIRMLTSKDRGFKEEFRNFNIEWSIGYLISFLEKEPKWNALAQQLDQVDYFVNMGSASKVGLMTIIGHMGIDGLRYHPWLAVPADDEELLEGRLTCFLYGINRLALALEIEQPIVSEFAYKEDGRLVLQLDSKTHTVLDKENFGENASYHIGTTMLSKFSKWLEINGRDESLYSLDVWNDHTAIVLTRQQISKLTNIMQSVDADGLELPHKRSLD